MLETAALIGSRVESSLLDTVTADTAAGIDGCLASGVMTYDDVGLRFRHEIARLAVEHAIPMHRRARLHAAVLAALRSAGSDDDARMAHHAEGAADQSAVLEYAPAAARKASELASHREAAAQYERSLRFADGEDAATVAALYDGLANEASLVDRWQDAADARQAALVLWREAGDRLREGNTLRLLSRAMWRLCRGAESVETAQAALAVLAPLPPSRELAWAYANLATQRMLDGEHEAAIEMAQRAQDLGERLGEMDVLSDALNSEATAIACGGGGWSPKLLRALEIALAAGLEEQAGRAYANLYSSACGLRRFADAEVYFVEGVAYCDEHDMSTFSTCLRGERARSLDHLGHWDEAVDLCTQMLERPGASPINRINPLITLGQIRARRGEHDPWQPLDEAAAGAEGADEPQWIAAARLARTEAAWVGGRTDAARREIERAAPAAGRCDGWLQGAADVWLHRLGMPLQARREVAEPYALHLAGDWRAASMAWNELGCPYEAAMALSDATDEAALREALAGFDELGAAATARVTRRRMRLLGLKAVPAGPRSLTRSHTFKLTRREQEVLDLLCAGLANAEISRRLFISERTVGHHVSAVLTKMGVPSRGVAASEALRLGLAGAAASKR